MSISFFQSCCLHSESEWFISWLRFWIFGWVGVVLRSWFLSMILVRICRGGFCFLTDISSWYELFVGCDDCDSVSFLMYTVRGDVV